MLNQNEVSSLSNLTKNNKTDVIKKPCLTIKQNKQKQNKPRSRLSIAEYHKILKEELILVICNLLI